MIELYILGGLFTLYIGAEGLVRGSVSIARRLGVHPLLIGLTIVAYGTSMPELTVSLRAALSGQGDISVGNIVGSNIFNIAFILGISALVRPLKVKSQLVRWDLPVMILVSFLLVVTFLDRRLGRYEGFAFALGIVLYTLACVHLGRKGATPNSTPASQGVPTLASSLGLCLLYIAAGLLLLVVGSKLLLNGSILFARRFGVSEAVIGLTIVAAGTSLPELATSVVAAAKRQPDIAVGNIVGSNIFNILGILGVSALASPLTVSGIRAEDLSTMLGIAVFSLPLMWTRFTLNRWEGAFFLATYGAYLWYRWPL